MELENKRDEAKLQIVHLPQHHPTTRGNRFTLANEIKHLRVCVLAAPPPLRSRPEPGSVPALILPVP